MLADACVALLEPPDALVQLGQALGRARARQPFVKALELSFEALLATLFRLLLACTCGRVTVDVELVAVATRLGLDMDRLAGGGDQRLGLLGVEASVALA